MEWVKTTAKTLPEAIDLALDNLGVDESEAEIVVLEEPRQGLFGRMRGTARVEARVKPKATRPKIERNRNRRNRSEGGSKGGGGDRNRNRNRNKGGGGGGGQGGGNRNSGGGNDGGRRGSKGGGGDRNRQGADGEARDDRQGQKKSSGRNRSRQGGSGAGRDQGGQGSKGRNNENAHDTKPKEESPVEEVAAHLETFLNDLTEAFGFDSDVTVDNSEADVLVGQIEGQHGLLVGPKGRTLDAVQELARISCQRTVPSSIRIKVDVGGYRAKRVEALQEFARKAADNAAESQLEVALEPMSPADRKAIHDALTDDERVETRSVGAEPRRKVLVVPVESEDDEHDEPEEDENAAAAEDSVEDSVNGDHDAADESADEAAAEADEMADEEA